MTLPPTPENPTPPNDQGASPAGAAQPPFVPPQPQPQYAPPPQPYAQPYGQPYAQPYGQPSPQGYAQPAGQQAYAYQTNPAPMAPAVAPGPGGPFDGAIHPDDLSRPLYGASFGQAIRRYFKSYAKFSGRASRSEYWWVMLFTGLITLVPAVFAFIGLMAMFLAATPVATSYDPYDTYDSYGTYASSTPPAGAVIVLILAMFLMLVITLALIVPTLALGWRRLHDGNFAGPLYLITLAGSIPYVGFLASIAVLVLTLLPSKIEGRRFDTTSY
ncbi:MAG: DUF805 domain-containing protein [Leucobacter sp.]|nr:DUF805 domain-containing protein [Leucobacter sp.]